MVLKYKENIVVIVSQCKSYVDKLDISGHTVHSFFISSHIQF